MQADLKYVSSIDIDPLSYWPDDEEYFGFFVEAFIGPKGKDSSERFQIFVCSLKWLEKLSKSNFEGKLLPFSSVSYTHLTLPTKA